MQSTYGGLATTKIEQIVSNENPSNSHENSISLKCLRDLVANGTRLPCFSWDLRFPWRLNQAGPALQVPRNQKDDKDDNFYRSSAQNKTIPWLLAKHRSGIFEKKGGDRNLITQLPTISAPKPDALCKGSRRYSIARCLTWRSDNQQEDFDAQFASDTLSRTGATSTSSWTTIKYPWMALEPWSFLSLSKAVT